jgi:hypothetical protein
MDKIQTNKQPSAFFMYPINYSTIHPCYYCYLYHINKHIHSKQIYDIYTITFYTIANTIVKVKVLDICLPQSAFFPFIFWYITTNKITISFITQQSYYLKY